MSISWCVSTKLKLTKYSMDAISFVLGIKSSHLRSAHLRDLVYRGRVLKTSKINDDGSAVAPNGQVNGDGEDLDEDGQSQKATRNDPKSAWVMAVYEDDAGDEQKWKRTITNQGASEYRINDRVVTAKQYNEALEAENILINARNFLVFQGDVEAIASQSPKDLTRLIEQISGSLEFKAEYERLEEESNQAAENQNYNLHRRRGINSEIKQYQEQKKEAEAFQAKADQRDEAIVTHILWKLYHFQRVMEESTASIQEHQENLKEYRRGVEKYQKTLDEAQATQSRVSKEVGSVERKIKKKEKEVEATENRLVPIDEKIDLTTQSIEKLQKKIGEVSKTRDEYDADVKKYQKSLASVEKGQKQYEISCQETMKKQGKQLSDADFKEYNSLRSQVVSKTAKNQSELDNLVRQMKTDEVTVNSLKGRVNTLQATVEKLESEIATINERKEAIKTQVKDTTKEVESKKKEYNQVISETVRIRQLRTEKEEKLQALARAISEADAGKRQTEKELRTRETIVSLKRLYPGVRGQVGDLCKPKQKKYETAASTALGRNYDAVIVDTEKTTTECVQYLKDQRLSPMTFIPLDNIKVTAPDANLKSLAKARLTIDTIDFDSSLERAMAYACGNSLICDDTATARQYGQDKRLQAKTISLEGTVFHKNGTVTGGRGPDDRGSQRKFNDQDVEKLREQARKFSDEIEALPKTDRKSAAEDALRADLTSLEQSLAYAKNELASFEQNLASKKKELSFEQKELKKMEPKYEEQQSAFERISETVQKFQTAVSKVQDEVFASFCKRLGYSDIRAYEAQQGSMEQEMAAERNKYEVQKKKLEGHLSHSTREREDLISRINGMEQRIKAAERDIESYQQEKEALENSIDEHRAHITELEDELHKLKEKLMAKTEKVTQARNELQKRSKEIDNRTKAIAALETEIQRNAAGRYALLRRCKLEQINIPVTKTSRKLDSLPLDDNVLEEDPDEMDVDEGDKPVEALVKDYGIEVDFEELPEHLQEPSEDDVEEQLLGKITELNSELEKLNPNMRAIDRLDGVEARLKATEKDFEDARKAAKRSRDAFTDVKEQRFELFNKAFSHISEQISHVYKDLTRSPAFPLGGQAYLDIEDSDAPYLSGIKYHAMPPLKRFRDMEHLSGGEKTMAALALLFAVHSYQPSPFFVLDEVDAALDNANVEKIRNYIREHAGPGMQFIVISLKTGLFQGSESLVGVFRDQEANSSKTLTLDVSSFFVKPFTLACTDSNAVAEICLRKVMKGETLSRWIMNDCILLWEMCLIVAATG